MRKKAIILSKKPAFEVIVTCAESRTVPEELTTFNVITDSPLALEMIVQDFPSADGSTLKLLLLQDHCNLAPEGIVVFTLA